MEFNRVHSSLRFLFLCTALGLPLTLPAQDNTILVLLQPGPGVENLRTFAPTPARAADSSLSGSNHVLFCKGRRSEFRIYNRKFFTDYSLTVDVVTSLTGAPMIRGLDEASTLAIAPPNLATPPVSKGEISTLTQRSTKDILSELLNETTAWNVRTEVWLIGRK